MVNHGTLVKIMTNHDTWNACQDHGKIMARSWQGHGKIMARSWQDNHGKTRELYNCIIFSTFFKTFKSSSTGSSPSKTAFLKTSKPVDDCLIWTLFTVMNQRDIMFERISSRILLHDVLHIRIHRAHREDT